MLPDHRRHGVAIDVADHDHGHEVGTIPVAIEPHQLLALRGWMIVGIADRRPVHIARSLELHAADLVRGPLAGAQVPPPLGEDDGTLAFDAAGSKGAPPAQSSRMVSARSRAPGTSVGTRSVYCVSSKLVAAFASAPMLSPSDEEVVDALSREMRGALELHVLDEVRQPSLVVVFKDRARLDDQPQSRPGAPASRSGARRSADRWAARRRGLPDRPASRPRGRRRRPTRRMSRARSPCVCADSRPAATSRQTRRPAVVRPRKRKDLGMWR